MDPVGATASVITLVDLALKTLKTVNSLAQSYYNAAVELAELKHQLNGLNSQLVLLRLVQEAVGDDALELGHVELNNLEQYLQDTVHLLSSIRDCFLQQPLNAGTGRRIRWALHDSGKVKKWESAVRRHANGLTNILLLLNVHYASLLHSEFKDFRHNGSLMQAMAAKMEPSHQARFLWVKKWTSADWIPSTTTVCEGSIHSIEEDQTLMYGISIRLHALFCLKTFSIDMKICRTPMFVNFLAPSTKFRVKNLVPESSEIMDACKRGDTSTVWSLFQAGKASVNDVTLEDRSPLCFAIQSGCTSLVSFLISNGAGVNDTYGRLQTSPLEVAYWSRQISVARLLLTNGAEVHHINANGWTPAFRLFGLSSQASTPCDEYLEALAASSFSEFNVQDAEGWSCTHRAAAFGQARDIRALIKLNATLTIRTNKLSWMPIFCAVQYGNTATFNELKTHHTDLLVMKDIRQWSLLHVAVNAERLEVMELLISLGADPHARTFPTEFFVPDDIKGHSVTPGDIAKLRGPAIFTAYSNALRTYGHEIEVLKDEMDGMGDLFWPALEDELGSTVYNQ